MASTKMEEDFPRYFGLLLRFLQSKTLQFSVPTSHVTNQETSATQTIIKYRQSEQLMLLCTQIVDQYYVIVETFLLAFRRVQYEFANLDISKLSISAQKYTIQTRGMWYQLYVILWKLIYYLQYCTICLLPMHAYQHYLNYYSTTAVKQSVTVRMSTLMYHFSEPKPHHRLTYLQSLCIILPLYYAMHFGSPILIILSDRVQLIQTTFFVQIDHSLELLYPSIVFLSFCNSILFGIVVQLMI